MVTHCLLCSAPQLVRHCKDGFLDLLRLGCIDLLFANEDEIGTLAVELQLASADGKCETPVSLCPKPSRE